jgi:hypothetical protein
MPHRPQLTPSAVVSTQTQAYEQPSGPESMPHCVGATEGQSPTHEYEPPPPAHTVPPQQCTPQAPQWLGSFNAPHSPVSASANTTSDPASMGQPKGRVQLTASPSAAASIEAPSDAASPPLLDPEPLPELLPELPPLELPPELPLEPELPPEPDPPLDEDVASAPFSATSS